MESFAEHVRRLCDERGYGTTRLSELVGGLNIPGARGQTVRNVTDLPNSKRRRLKELPTLVVIEAISYILEIDPNEFPVYRIQRARLRLDPDAVSWERALENAELLLSQSALSPPEDARETAQRRLDKRRTSKRTPRMPKAKGQGS